MIAMKLRLLAEAKRNTHIKTNANSYGVWVSPWFCFFVLFLFFLLCNNGIFLLPSICDYLYSALQASTGML